MFTIVILVVLQTAIPLQIIFSQGLADGFDWAGFIGFSLGSIAVPLAIGCVGLLWRKRRGVGFFLMSVAAFVALEAVRVAGVTTV